jgi:TRAP-type uncharacterized transport system substrate-binding protein
VRTTIDIEDDVLAAAKEMASQQRVSVGTVVSRLLRQAMSGVGGNGQSAAAGLRSVAGFQPFPSQGVLITNAQIEALRDVEGI